MLSVVYVMDSFVNHEVFVRAPLQGNLVHSALLKMTGTDKHWWKYIMYLSWMSEKEEKCLFNEVPLHIKTCILNF